MSGPPPPPPPPTGVPTRLMSSIQVFSLLRFALVTKRRVNEALSAASAGSEKLRVVQPVLPSTSRVVQVEPPFADHSTTRTSPLS